MSFIPLMFSDWWEDLDEAHQIPAQNFAVGMDPGRLPEAPKAPLSQFYNHPWQTFRNFYLPRRAPVRQDEQGMSIVKPDKDKFHVALDIQQFTPEEIKVKVINNYVLVEGKHDEKRDEHGSITRHFIRKYLIPEQCDVDKVTSSLSSDGVLTLNAPRKNQSKPSEREISIERTGKPAVGDGKPSKDDIETIDTKNIGNEVGEDQKKPQPVEDTQKKPQPVEDTQKRPQPVEDTQKKPQPVEDTQKRPQPVEDTQKKPQPVEDTQKKPQPVEETQKKPQPVGETQKKPQPVEETRKKLQPVEETRKKSQPVEETRKKSQSVEEIENETQLVGEKQLETQRRANE